MWMRRLFAVGVLTVSGAAALTTATAIAGGTDPLSALTGLQILGSNPNAQAVGIGESLALGASNDVPVGLSLTKDITFAPGYEAWKAETIAFEMQLGPGAPPAGQALMSSSALRWQVAESAACSWVEYYIASGAADNTTATASAAAQIAAAPSWPAITGLAYPSGLGPVVAAISVSDTNLAQALIDTAQVGSASCTTLGPIPPSGMSTAAARAKLAAARQLGQQEIAADPNAQRLGIAAG
ncbi:MAG: hypothetical protein ACRDMX_04230 [Solirubrobacteraceae bacterium]